MGSQSLIMLLERIVQRIETQFCVKFMTGIVIVRHQMGGKGGFVRLPQEFGSFLVHACRSHQVGKLQPCFECCIPLAIAFCPIQIDTKIMDGRVADICLVLLINFPIPSKKREIGGVGIQQLALQPGNAPFTHGDIVPMRLDSLIQRSRQCSERRRAGSQSHTLPYHDGKKTKNEQSPFHDHKVHANIARNPAKQ